MSSEIDLDTLEKFLKKKAVKSEFLEDLYASKYTLRDQYNLKDIEGRRLSGYWRNGDTILSVTWKKTSEFLTLLFNPDTYSKRTYKQIKKQIQIIDVYIYMFIGLACIPLMIYIPFVLPRVKKVRKDYLFHQYLKKKTQFLNRFFEEELKTGKRNIKLRDMKKILKNLNEENV